MTSRTSFALDLVSVERIRRLAGRWHVSQAEVVRRALEMVENQEAARAGALLGRLETYHARGGLNLAAADAWATEVAEARQDWGRES